MADFTVDLPGTDFDFTFTVPDFATSDFLGDFTSTAFLPTSEFTSRSVSATSTGVVPEPTGGSGGGSGDEEYPTIVYTPSGDSDEPCAQVQDVATQWQNDRNPYLPLIPAELALECFESVPAISQGMSDTLTALNTLIPFETTLEWLASPPDSYQGNTVDILAGLQNISDSLDSFDSQWAFESALVDLVGAANSGHFNFVSSLASILTWIRPFDYSLVSVTTNSSDSVTPGIYLYNDIVSGNPNEITQINGQPAADFLESEAQNLGFQGPDARYQSLFNDPAQSGATLTSYGEFIFPQSYPGPTTELTYADGSTDSFQNLALFNGSLWEGITDGRDFYNSFVTNRYSSGSSKRSEKPSVPLRERRDIPLPPKKLKKREFPDGYPEPFASPDFDDPTLFFSGYFLPYGGNQYGLAILSSPTFLAQTESDVVDFNTFIGQFLSECTSRNTQKIIVDMSSNGGGTAMLSFSMYKQFFPDRDVSLRYQFRASDGMNVLGSINSDSTRDDQISTFDSADYLDNDGESFSSWDDFYGPVEQNGGEFTNFFQFDLANNAEYLGGLELEIPGFGGVPVTPAPFAPEDIVVLTNGMCSSACNNFVELMVSQGDVRTVTMGGRPLEDVVDAVGGVQGGVVLTDPQLSQEADVAIQVAPSSLTQEDVNTLPLVIPNNNLLRLNTMNAHRGTNEVPIQFAARQADCHLFYSEDMVTDVTMVWRMVADIAWDSDNNIDTGRCVGGSGSGSPPEDTGEPGSGGSDGSGGGSGGDDSDSGSDDQDDAATSSWKIMGTTTLLAWVAIVVGLTL